MVVRVLALFGLPALVFAQGKGFTEILETAPPHIESALRDRIAAFYRAHKEGKFLAASEMVHEDSKDAFIGSEKLTFRDFKIVTIAYEENFSKARVVIDADTDFLFPGFGKMAVHRPVSSFWKQERGQWRWHAAPVTTDWPFGTRSPGSGGGGTDDWGSIWSRAPKVADLHSLVKADKQEVELLSHAPSSAAVEIRNSFPGAVRLRLQAPDMQGFSAKLDREELREGESAKLTIECLPLYPRAKKPDLSVQVAVEPLGKTIPVAIRFANPPNP